MTPKVTPAQIQKIWATAREKGISSELLHSITFEITNKESLKDLNVREAGQVIDRLCGKRRTMKRYEPSGYVAKMSHDQYKQISNMIATIERLGKKYTIEAIADKVAQKNRIN